MANPSLIWERAAWPGIYVCRDQYRIRVRAIDPSSGRLQVQSWINQELVVHLARRAKVDSVVNAARNHSRAR